jgi:hypothetical protein
VAPLAARRADAETGRTPAKNATQPVGVRLHVNGSDRPLMIDARYHSAGRAARACRTDRKQEGL